MPVTVIEKVRKRGASNATFSPYFAGLFLQQKDRTFTFQTDDLNHRSCPFLVRPSSSPDFMDPPNSSLMLPRELIESFMTPMAASVRSTSAMSTPLSWGQGLFIVHAHFRQWERAHGKRGCGGGAHAIALQARIAETRKRTAPSDFVHQGVAEENTCTELTSPALVPPSPARPCPPHPLRRWLSRCQPSARPDPSPAMRTAGSAAAQPRRSLRAYSRVEALP